MISKLAGSEQLPSLKNANRSRGSNRIKIQQRNIMNIIPGKLEGQFKQIAQFSLQKIKRLVLLLMHAK